MHQFFDFLVDSLQNFDLDFIFLMVARSTLTAWALDFPHHAFNLILVMESLVLDAAMSAIAFKAQFTHFLFIGVHLSLL